MPGALRIHGQDRVTWQSCGQAGPAIQAASRRRWVVPQDQTNNYTRVDEVTPDDATSYNASDTANASDLFTVGSNSIASNAAINLVQVGAVFANITTADTTTALKLQIEQTSGGTIYKSNAIVPDSTTWVTDSPAGTTVNYPVTLAVDPTGAGWTTTTLGSMQIGYLLSTAGTHSIGVSTLWAYVDYTPVITPAYYVKNYASDLSTGTGNYVVSPHQDNTYDSGTVSVSIPSSSSVTYSFFTPANLPANTGTWGTTAATAVVNITTSAANTNVSASMARINSSGSVQVQSSFSSTVATTSTGVKTLAIPSTNYGTGAATDRILYQLKFTNTTSGTEIVVFGISDGIHTLTTNISEYVGNSPATISGLRAYDHDDATAIGNNGDGTGPGVYLDFDINPLVEDESTLISAPSVEVQPHGTSFTGTALATSKDLMYDSDEPMGVYESPIVWDSTQNRFLMFGGYANDTSVEKNELWELRLDNGKGKWRQLFPTGTYPAARWQGGLAFDALNNQLIVVFGYTTADTNTLYYCSFANDSVNGQWVSRTPGGTAPSTRSSLTDSTITDYTNHCAYVCGGWGASLYNGIYKLTFSTTTPGGTWSTLAADGAGGAPTANTYWSAKLDTANNRIITFAGNTSSSGTSDVNTLSAFSLSSNTWSTLSPTGTAPAARQLQTMAYDPTNQRMIMHAGETSAYSNIFNDLWNLSTSTTNCAWTNITPSTTDIGQMCLGVKGAASAYSPLYNVIIIWGVSTTLTTVSTGSGLSTVPSQHRICTVCP